MGHLRLIIGYLKATVVHIRLTLGHLRVTIGRLFFSTSQHKANTTELHPKVSSWMLNGFTKFHGSGVILLLDIHGGPVSYQGEVVGHPDSTALRLPG